MKKFNESFYTNDFDQEMLNFIKDNLNTTKNIEHEWCTVGPYLKYCTSLDYFWTGGIASGNLLTKNQFKDKIGMTNESQPEKQERIFKLIDKDGYVCADSSNRQTLTDNGIFVDGFYYYKGIFNIYGDLKPSLGCLITTLIDAINGEFEYFEEVDCIPLPKDKPKIEEVFVNQTNTLTKSMLKSGEHVVKLADDSYHIVLGNRLVRGDDYIQLKSVSETLECSFDADLDIVAVYKVNNEFILNELPSGKSLTLIWERESPEQKEKRLQKEKLELKLQELQKECKLVEDEIMKLEEL